VGAILTTGLALFLRLPDVSLDLTPWNHWRTPAVGGHQKLDGPVLVIVEYEVEPEQASDFLVAIYEYGRIRRRDGASRWGICRDLVLPDRYLETFIVSSWDEHLRQHDRLTRADSQLEKRIRTYSSQEPSVRHLAYL